MSCSDSTASDYAACATALWNLASHCATIHDWRQRRAKGADFSFIVMPYPRHCYSIYTVLLYSMFKRDWGYDYVILLYWECSFVRRYRSLYPRADPRMQRSRNHKTTMERHIFDSHPCQTAYHWPWSWTLTLGLNLTRRSIWAALIGEPLA